MAAVPVQDSLRVLQTSHKNTHTLQEYIYVHKSIREQLTTQLENEQSDQK